MKQRSVLHGSVLLAVMALAVLFAGLAAGRGRSAAAARTSPPARSSGAKPTPAFQPGELIVKYKPQVRPPAAQLQANGQRFAAYTGSDYLDKIHQRYRAKEIRPLFTAPGKMAAGRAMAEATADEWAAHVQHTRERFPVRARRAPAHQRLPDLSTIYKITVPEDTDVKQLAAEYAGDPSVEYAEPNYIYHTCLTPNDPFWSSSGSWGQRYADLWGLHNIHADEAWDLSTGAGVTVAVIDTGLRYDHPDIAANLWSNPGEIAGNGIDDDGNGYIDDVHGWAFWGFANNNGPYQADTAGHGTHVSGIIAAAGNNGIGVIGVAWQAHVMALGVFDAIGQATITNISAALLYAVHQGADVVNMSFGGYGDSFVIRDAIDYATANGLVLVAAAGNDTVDVKNFYPAAFDPVMAVAAVDHFDQPSWFSNFGGQIELAAPGGGDSRPPLYEPSASVLSLSPASACGYYSFCFIDPKLVLDLFDGGGTFIRLGGTSMAAPHVAGTAALILSRHPEFTAEQVRQALRNGADDLGPPGRDARYGYGRLNAAQSVALDQVAVARLQAPKHLSRVHGEMLDVTGTVQNPGGGAPSWELLFGPQGQALTAIASGTGEVDSGVLATIDTAPLVRDNYSVQLQVTGPNGATASDNLVFTRLADRPYARQISDQGGTPFLLANAITADGNTIVWTDNSQSSHRLVAGDLRTGSRDLVQFQFGTGTLAENMWHAEAAISSDGSTVAFNAPEDLSTSNTSVDNRNFQLFLFNTADNTLQQVSHAVGGLPGDFTGLTISADGSRIAFLSQLPLDPTVENPGGTAQVFYWERATNAFHQVTADLSGIVAPDLSADGARIAFAMNGVSVYDVASNVTWQFPIPISPPPTPGVQIRSNATVALSADGSKLAGSADTIAPDGAHTQRSVFVIDVGSGRTTNVVTMTAPNTYVPDGVRFSADGTAVYFSAGAVPDPLFLPFKKLIPPPLAFSLSGLFEYNLATGMLHRLSAFGSGPAVAADGRMAQQAAFIGAGIDPEGGNADGTDEIYLLDPATGGGFLWLQHGHVRQRASDADTFQISGRLLQPTVAGLDPGSNDLSLTLLSANGQVFRSTLPAGTMRGGNGRWTYGNSSAPDVTRLVLTTSDGTHYRFSASGHGAGLFSQATPYLTVEIQVGDAVFSNAQTFRLKGRQWRYP